MDLLREVYVSTKHNSVDSKQLVRLDREQREAVSAMKYVFRIA